MKNRAARRAISRCLLMCGWGFAAGTTSAGAAVAPHETAGIMARSEVDVVAGGVTTGGIVVAPEKVATLCHRLAGQPTIGVRAADGPIRAARLVAGNQDRDVCVLDVPGLDAVAASLSQKSSESDTRAFLNGARYGRDSAVSLDVCCHAWVSDDGVYSALRPSSGAAAFVPPTPGAGTYDGQGRLIGMVADKAPNVPLFYMVLPVEWIATVAAQMPPVDLPLSGTAWMSGMRAYDAARDADGRIRYALQWTDARPQSAWAWGNLGNAYRASALPDKAARGMAAYRQAVTVDPAYVNGWNALGAMYGEQRQWDLAIDALRAGLRANPSDALLLSNMGRLYLQLGRKSDAKPWLEQAVGHLHGQRRADALRDLALAQQDAETGIGIVRDALKAFPKDAPLWGVLGGMELEQGKVTEAIGDLQRALALSHDGPTTAGVWATLSIAYQKQRQLDQAVDAMRAATGVARTNAGYWRRLGALYASQSKFGDALPAFDQAVALDDRDGATWFARGIAQAQLAQHPQAVSSLRRAVALNDRNADWWTALATELNDAGQSAEAKDAAARALTIDPANRFAQIALGVANIRARNPEAAVRVFEQLDDAHPNDMLIVANLAVAYRRAGRIDDAVRLYRRVKALNPPLAQRLYDEELKGVAEQ